MMGLTAKILNWLAPKAERSWPLDNLIQAQAFSGILTQEGIPHRIRRNGEALLGYLEQAREGWGRVETEPQFYEQMERLYQDFLVSDVEDQE